MVPVALVNVTVNCVKLDVSLVPVLTWMTGATVTVGSQPVTGTSEFAVETPTLL